MDTAVAESGLDQLCINTIRALAMDAVQKANSGHPGAPMALAPVAYTLWQKHLRFDPADPIWPDRDRFVLSNGHASMLLYALLHLARVQAVDSDYNKAGHPSVSLDDIKRFRQLDSHAPGHPEYHLTSGVETTTGPLGQGVGNSVGMAIAARWLAARYNRPGFDLFGYRVYAMCGDGDMMEGVSSEAASMAGHQKLANLCWIYDSNTVTIEGHTPLAFSEDVGARFRAYGWAVEHVDDANDTATMDAALSRFAAGADRPTLIIVRSIIGYGAPNKQNTEKAHGEALGEDEVRLAKRFFGWPEDAHFLVPDGMYDQFARGIGARGAKLNADWRTLFQRYAKAHPALANEVELMQRRELPDGWDKEIPSFPADPKGAATRDSGGKVLNAIAKNLPWLLGGAADLAPSTKTNLTFEGAGSLEADAPGARNMHFGIREHAMGAICNGLALSKLRPFGATFLIFSDYMKPPIRLSSLMELPTVWVFTHDSIGLGEDGPTHQPVEQLLSLRAVPGLVVLRPADANEVAEAWRLVVSSKHQPYCLVLTRQAVPTFDRTRFAAASGLRRGAYVLADPPDGKPEVILIGTGSEVQLCVATYEALAQEGVRSRVVSMPSWELFEQQDEAYRAQVLPPEIVARVAVEQGSTIGWDRYAGRTGAVIGMHTFGASAPLKALLGRFGFTPEATLAAAKAQIAQQKSRST
jgi:transketolase